MIADRPRKFLNHLPEELSYKSVQGRSHLNLLKSPRTHKTNDAALKRPIVVSANLYPNRLSSTSDLLLRSLRLVSADAWSKTEALLKDEVERYGMDSSLIDPWAIVGDSYALFEQAIEHYAKQGASGPALRSLIPVIAKRCSQLRQSWSKQDARVLGFVSMHVHYTGKMLLERMPMPERSKFEPYVRFLEEQLYLPLQELYQAAAQSSVSPATLRAVQCLLPLTSKIARRVVKRIANRHSQYQSYSGHLTSRQVHASSLRDVEMFLLYLGLSSLQGNTDLVEQRLFPICNLLYPRLHVTWDLVQEMLDEIAWELHHRLLPDDMMQIAPYLRMFTTLFSEQETLS
jgi:Phycobilisome protein